MRHFDKIDPRLVRREVANRQYEIADEGTLFLPKSKIWIGGQFEHDVLRGGKLLGAARDPNIVVNQGLNALLDIMFHAATQITAWYVGIFEGNYTPLATDTAANITANSTECTAYDEATRVAYDEAAASGQSITNAASKATFTMNSTKTVREPSWRRRRPRAQRRARCSRRASSARNASSWTMTSCY